MSEFDERVRTSTATQNLKVAVDALRDLKSQEWEQQRTIDLIDRLYTVGAHVLHRLSAADRALVTQRTLNELEGPSQQFVDAVDQIDSPSSSDEPDYTGCTDIADNLLFVAASLPISRSRGTGEIFERASARFDQESASSAALLAERSEAVLSQVNEYRSKLQEDWNSFQDSLSAMESQVNNRSSQAENEARSMIAEVQTATDSLLSQVSEATERLEREVTSIQESFRNAEQSRANEFVNSQNSRLEAQHNRDTEYREWLEANKSEAADLQEQARTMLEEVAGASTAEHYMKLRGEQNRSANIWRWITIGSFLFLIAASVYIYFDIQSIENLSVATAIARYGVAFPSLALATYALRQSGHHRKREEDTARVSHELMLLWPFMNRLSEEERQAQLKIITPLYFKGGLTPQDAGDKVGLLDHIPGFARDRSRTQPPG